jgi:catechol-2,3-dioxygenase
MKIKEIGFVGIPVTDMPRARKFYEDILGLHVSDEMMGGKWIEYAIGDNTLAIANVGEEWKPSDQGQVPRWRWKTSTKRLTSSKIKVYRSPQSPLKRPVVTWRWCKIRTETSS